MTRSWAEAKGISYWLAVVDEHEGVKMELKHKTIKLPSKAKGISSGIVVVLEVVADALEASCSEGRFNVIDEQTATDTIKLEKWIYGQVFFLLPSIESCDHRGAVLLASREKDLIQESRALFLDNWGQPMFLTNFISQGHQLFILVVLWPANLLFIP